MKNLENDLEKARIKVFKTKEGPHLQDYNHQKKDFEFPDKELLYYNYHIIGFICAPGSDWFGANFILSNEKKSDLPLNFFGSYQEVRIKPVGAVVRRVIMFGNHEYGGVQFFDANGRKILDAGITSGPE